ncbi:MAG: LysE family translocator [Melioribacteraceae bacterium]|nr:LysE family translocator [Melioribacteraceae bacterium]
MIDNSVYGYLISGILLGAGSAITPGPLTALVISQSLKYGKREGIKVAIAPALTDAPIILLSLLFIIEISKLEFLLGIVTIFGSIFIIFLGYKDLKYKTNGINFNHYEINSLIKGVSTNLVTPYPYIFWITIGAPLVLEAYSMSTIHSIAFIGSFYLMLIGFKVILALFTDKIREVLKNNSFKVIVNIMGMVLILFGVILFINGINRIIE